MKVLLSYWMGPESEENAGFLNRKDFLASITTSVILANQFYDVVFACDEYAWKLLKGLDLPFQNVEIIEIPKKYESWQFKKFMWSYSKFKALLKYDGPLIHIDHDVYLQKPLQDFDDVLVQNAEQFDEYFTYYNDIIRVMKRSKRYTGSVPRYLNWYDKVSYNCGTLGWKNDSYMKEWVNSIIHWIETSDINALVNSKQFLYVLIYEQYSLAQYCKYYNLDVQYVMGERMEKDGREIGYSHFASWYKRNGKSMQKIHVMLNNKWPYYVEKIEKTLKDIY